MRIEPLDTQRPQDPWDVVAQYRQSLGLAEPKQADPAQATEGCQTCKDRKYQDGSNDPGVSFKTPTKVSAGGEAAAVRGHEQEHVTRNRDEARREGRRVVSQSVTYHTAICAECGRSYVSGGTTRTTTKSVEQPRDRAKGFDQYA